MPPRYAYERRLQREHERDTLIRVCLIRRIRAMAHMLMMADITVLLRIMLRACFDDVTADERYLPSAACWRL